MKARVKDRGGGTKVRYAVDFGVIEKGRTKAGNECDEAKDLANQAAPDSDDDENQRYDDEQYIESIHKRIA